MPRWPNPHSFFPFLQTAEHCYRKLQILLLPLQIHANFKWTPSWPKPYYLFHLPPFSSTLPKQITPTLLLNFIYQRWLLPPDPLRNWFPCCFVYTSTLHTIWKIELVQYMCIWLKQTKNIECTFYKNFYLLFPKELWKILAKYRWRAFPCSSHPGPFVLSCSTGFTVLLCPVGLNQNGCSSDFHDSGLRSSLHTEPHLLVRSCSGLPF